jgi:hypothetical protein
VKISDTMKRTVTIELEGDEIVNVLRIARDYLHDFAGDYQPATDTAHDIVNALETNPE